MGRRVVRSVAVPLSKGQHAKIDKEDVWILKYKWHASWQPTAKTYYAYRTMNGRKKAMHRVLLDPPDGMDVHHRNGNGLDNRRSNIVVCTRGQNLAARPGWGRYPKGVVFRAERTGKGQACYEAKISIEGRKIYLGRRDTPEEAGRLYDEAAKELYGEFASLNFPDEN